MNQPQFALGGIGGFLGSVGRPSAGGEGAAPEAYLSRLSLQRSKRDLASPIAGRLGKRAAQCRSLRPAWNRPNDISRCSTLNGSIQASLAYP
jgi:hypothetical protein